MNYSELINARVPKETMVGLQAYAVDNGINISEAIRIFLSKARRYGQPTKKRTKGKN